MPFKNTGSISKQYVDNTIEEAIGEVDTQLTDYTQQYTRANMEQILRTKKYPSDIPLRKTKGIPEDFLTLIYPNALTDVSFYQTGTSDDPSILFNGNSTVKIVPTTGAVYVRQDLGTSTDISGYKYVDLHLYCNDISAFTVIQVEFSSVTNFIDSFSLQVAPLLQAKDDDGWRFIRIPLSQFTHIGTGTSTLETIRYFRISVNGTSVQLNIGKCQLTKAYNKARVFLYLDDGSATQYSEAFRIAKSYGLKGTISLVTSLIGTTGYMTWAQALEMQAAGWIVCSHTHTHQQIATLTKAQIRDECGKSKRALESNGFTFGSRCLVTPGGSISTATDVTVREFFDLVRTSSYTAGTHSDTPQHHPRSQKFTNPTNTSTAAEIKTWIDEAVSGKNEIALAFHQVLADTSGATYAVTPAIYTEVIAYLASLKEAGSIEIVTWADTMF